MNTRPRQALKVTLVGLSVVFLPLQYPMAASCSCIQRQDADFEMTDRVTRQQVDCCQESASAAGRCCSNDVASCGGLHPCTCPLNCGNHDGDTASELPPTEVTAADEWFGSVGTLPGLVLPRLANSPLRSQNLVPRVSGSSKICALLCRFTL